MFATKPAAATAATPNMNLRVFMAFLSVCSLFSTRGGRGDRLQIRNDGVDLAALQVMLEGRHARRALADDAADYLVAPAGRLLGQAGTIGARVHRRRPGTEPARQG